MNPSKSYKMAVVPGNGTDRKVIADGLKVLQSMAATESIKYELTRYDLKGERYQKTGDILPDSVLEEFKNLIPSIWEPSAIRMSNR